MSSSEGSNLSALQIANHGRDRYPTPKANAEKLVVEAAELLGAIEWHAEHCVHQPAPPGQPPWAGTHAIRDCPKVRGELADVGLCLFALGNKVQIDPIVAMRELVDADQRRFA